jgi:hypothetical protein
VDGTVSLIFSEPELDEVLSKHPGRLVVLFGGVSWCRPCKGVSKPFERMADLYDKAIFLKLVGAGCHHALNSGLRFHAAKEGGGPSAAAPQTASLRLFSRGQPCLNPNPPQYGNANVSTKRLFQRLKIRRCARRGAGAGGAGGAHRRAASLRPLPRTEPARLAHTLQRDKGSTLRLSTPPHHPQHNPDPSQARPTPPPTPPPCSTPSFLMFRNGEIVGQTSGANKEKLENAIREQMTADELAGKEPLYREGAAAAATS